MSCFLLFNKKGIVLYKEGDTPSFLNNVIAAIDPMQLSGSRRIRDDIMEYEIDGQIVYLSIGDKGALNEKMAQFKPLAVQLEENQCITPEMLIAKENNDENKPKQAGTKKKQSRTENIDKAARAAALEIGERSNSVVSVIASVKNAAVGKAFRLFTNKIDIGELHAKMVDHLIGKNVEASFSHMIADDVAAACRGCGKGAVTETEFRGLMAQTIGRLLPITSPEKLLAAARAHGVGFTICFVGVNGVGKSTSLAKVACWLIQNGMRVYIAACDTFRAGAIEQLKVHVERFKLGGHEVGFYESGYSKDDATVAKAAIARAIRENYDVVLIDTAGRMHRRENLMQSLSKLIKVNNPDHVLFVGEALVGGDSLSHIKEFNRWISTGIANKKIDSIVLTKVDTVDDKIGQVINLSFTAAAPILFLGVGQANSDLLPMDPGYISELLTS